MSLIPFRERSREIASDSVYKWPRTVNAARRANNCSLVLPSRHGRKQLPFRAGWACSLKLFGDIQQRRDDSPRWLVLPLIYDSTNAVQRFGVARFANEWQNQPP